MSDQLPPSVPGAISASSMNRLMLLLIGAPFTGKTYAAATFPNAVFLDFDHKARPGTTIVPFWNPAFVNRIIPPINQNAPPNKRDALITYLETQIGRGIPTNATLIVDSGSAVEAAFHHQTEKVDPVPLGKGGKPDGFWVWGQKLKYFGMLFELLKCHPGHVVYIMHEQPEKTESGLPNGRIKPLMSGSFVDQIASHFTAMFRQRIVIAKNEAGKDQAYYVWDTRPTKEFECNNTFDMPETTVKASYESVAKYFQPINS